jgi:hypothetical protein
MITNDVKLSGFHGSGLYPHALFSKIEGKTVDLPGSMTFVTLIDYRYPQRYRFRRRWNLPLTLPLLELVGILN